MTELKETASGWKETATEDKEAISPCLPDAAARERIATDLSSTIFVEAGAGSGKTAALVGRILELLRSGEVEMSQVAAITFTDKAADELRSRIRSELQRRAERPGDPTEISRYRNALGQLDATSIGTLHSFARRLLAEHGLEAGLPPVAEVLDEVSSSVAFEQRWVVFRDQLVSVPQMERSLLFLFAAGIRIESLRAIARAFEENWDLVEERVPPSADEPPSAHEGFAVVKAAIEALDTGACTDPSDKLLARISELRSRGQEVAMLEEEWEVLQALGPNAATPWPSCAVRNLGRKAAWEDVEEARRGVLRVGDAIETLKSDLATAAIKRVASAMRAFTLAGATERRRSGRLSFHDLLVLARTLLTDPTQGQAVRARLHESYRRILIDELQDTDPIQIELAVRIAAVDPSSERSGELPWQDVETAPGHLFVVGDPKQSIYRFRRADIATFLQAGQTLGGPTNRLELTSNFRSGRSILDWVNATFARLMDRREGKEIATAARPDYVALAATRTSPEGGAAVSVLGRKAHQRDVSADEMRTAEANDVAAAAGCIIEEGWHVDDGAGGWRPAKLSDIAILLPARTSLAFLEDSLEEAGLAYRSESSSLVYATRPVRDLLMVMRAVDDPTNQLHVVSALRTPLMACGDDDLFRFRRQRGGKWNYLEHQPASVAKDDPVSQALEYLRDLHEIRHWLSPSQLLDRIARERRAFEIGFFQGRERDLWRRLRLVREHARAWSEATSGNLRQYLQWADEQSSEGTRLAQAVLPETDDEAIRVMTIHASKGLEFPIVILSGMSTVPGGGRAQAQVVFPPGEQAGYRFASQVTTQEYEAWKPLDEQMDHDERIRLLYVACTRARDHLVVSLTRKEHANPPRIDRRTSAEVLVDGMGDLLEELPDAPSEPTVPPAPKVPSQPLSSLMPFEQWQAEREEALRRSSVPQAVAATAVGTRHAASGEAGHANAPEVDAGLEKDFADLDHPPWMKGRYGSALGRAVHGVLQSIDLDSGDDLAGAAAAQCEAESIPERTAEVIRLVGYALSSPSVREAASRSHWRELYVCTPIGERLLEGYVDLLYRSDDGLVIVDYKTSASSDEEELDKRAKSYASQLSAYALGVATATGELVARATLVFLTPSGALELDVPDLEVTMARTGLLV